MATRLIAPVTAVATRFETPWARTAEARLAWHSQTAAAPLDIDEPNLALGLVNGLIASAVLWAAGLYLIA